jgi:hypothetical protein
MFHFLATTELVSGKAPPSAARFGRTHNLSTNQASANAPTLKITSPGTRIHTSVWMMGFCMNSAERANQ